MAYTYSKLATVTVGTNTPSTIDLIGIPQNYTDLLMVCSLRSTRSAQVNSSARIYFNGVTSNLFYLDVLGNGSAVGKNNASTGAYIFCPASSATANTFGNSQVYIPNYTGIDFKSYSVEFAAESNSSSIDAQGIAAGIWSNSNAINSISLTEANSTSFAQYSKVTLYGIKAEV